MALKRASKGPTVVLVGRPNVGKSTLFNRITNSRRSIVTAIPGTTRDVIAQPAEWQGVIFTLVDTGGMFGASADPLHELVILAGRRAVETADIIVFVVDGREGLVPGDQEIAARLRSAAVPVLMAVNKTDDKRARGRAVEFYQLGFEPVVEMAAEHGEGVGDLLDEIIQRLPARRDAPEEPDETAVAIVGRPNVGKSSLLNRLLHEERSIVSETPGTTRDTVDAVLKWRHRTFRIVDTAGIRRKGRVASSGQLESLSVILARRAIEKADVAVLLVDSVEGATDQDATIAGEAEKAGCGIIIAANKWDLMKGRGTNFSKEFDDKLRQQMKFLEYAPILHISAHDRRADAESARDDRPGRGGADPAHSDGGVEPVHSDRDRRAPAGKPGPQAGADHVCDAEGRGAADVRALHQRRNRIPFLVRAVSGQSAAGNVRVHRDADPAARAAEAEVSLVSLTSRRVAPCRPRAGHNRAVDAGADAELGAEGAVEVRDVAEAAVVGHVEYGRRLRHQACRRFTQTRAQHVLVRRHTGHALERPEEVIRAQAGLTGQARQRELDIGTAFDHPHDLCHAGQGVHGCVRRAGAGISGGL